MKVIICLTLLAIIFVANLEGKRTSISRGSSSRRASVKKTISNSQSAPQSFSSQQASGSQQTSGWQQKPSANHHYPPSQTGLSGQSSQKVANSNQQSHSYPSSGGLSGQSAGYPQTQGTGLSGNAKGAGYPQQGGQLNGGSGYPQQHSTGHAGNAAVYPHQQGHSRGVTPPPYPGNPSYGGQPNSGGSYPNNNYQHQSQGPPYSGSGYGSPGSYHKGYSPQSPGYFGNHASYGGVSRPSNSLRNFGLAGAGVGTVLTGLALWNLARSTGRHHNTVIYDNRGQPIAVAPADSTEPVVDSILKDLVNCSLTIENDNAVEVLAIPCAIATSFTPNAEVNDPGMNNNSSDNTKCIVTVLTKEGKEFMTTIPCSTLVNTAADNNVTEPLVQLNETNIATYNPIISTYNPVEFTESTDHPVDRLTEITKVLNCTQELGEIRDPINPCFALTSDLSVHPLLNETLESPTTTPVAA